MDLLRHLRFFVAVAEEEHFGHAADRLGMTQPPLSQGILRLERRLGVSLLTRSPRGVLLTRAGTDLLPRARALLADADEFETEGRRYRENGVAVRVGVIPQLPDRCVAAIAAELRGEHAVVLSTASTVDLVDSVVAGRLDHAVVHHPALIHGLDCGAVVSLPRQLLVPAEHPAAQARSLRAMRGLPFAVAPRAHGTAAFDLLQDTLRERGLDPEFVPAPHERDVVAAVAAGHAFGLTAEPTTQVPGVSRVDLAVPDLALRVRVVHGVASEVVELIESVLRAEAAR